MVPSKCAVNLFTFYRYVAHKTAETRTHTNSKISSTSHLMMFRIQCLYTLLYPMYHYSLAVFNVSHSFFSLSRPLDKKKHFTVHKNKIVVTFKSQRTPNEMKRSDTTRN